MRRLAAVIALAGVCAAVLVLVLGGDTLAPSSGLVDEAVGYFPKDAPLLAVVESDPNGPQTKAFARLLRGIPVVDLLVDHVTGKLELRDVDFSSKLRPFLGKPVAIGVEPREFERAGLKKAIVVATRVHRPIEMKRLLLGQPTLTPQITDGRRIWESRFGTSFAAAVDNGVFVAGGSREAVAEALAERRSPQRMRGADFRAALVGLPAGAGIRMLADPRALLAGSRALRPALSVKWLSSMQRLGLTLKARAGGLVADFRLETDKDVLTDADLPLAPGRGAPLPLIGSPAELAVAARDPARLIRLGTAVWQALDPKHAARAAAVARPLRAHGLDLERDVLAHLGPSATAAVDLLRRTWAARIGVRSPAAVRLALQRIAGSLPSFADALGFPGVGVATPDQGASFYALARPTGLIAVFGVVGSSLVAASEPHRVAGIVSERTHFAPGGRGALVADVDARKLALRFIVPRLSGAARLGAPLALASLGQATVSATIDRSGLRGHATLAVK